MTVSVATSFAVVINDTFLFRADFPNGSFFYVGFPTYEQTCNCLYAIATSNKQQQKHLQSNRSHTCWLSGVYHSTPDFFLCEFVWACLSAVFAPGVWVDCHPLDPTPPVLSFFFTCVTPESDRHYHTTRASLLFVLRKWHHLVMRNKWKWKFSAVKHALVFVGLI